MQIIRHLFLIILIHTTTFSQKPTESTQKSQTTSQSLLSDARQVAQLLFNPVKAGSNGVEKNSYPTSSLNESAVDAFFSKALGVDAQLVTYIKNFYFYLEYIVRVEYAARVMALAAQKNIDSKKLIDQSWSAFIAALTTSIGSWQKIEELLFTPTLTPLWTQAYAAITTESWKKLSLSDFWKSMPLTQASILKSQSWQRYLKYEVYQSFKEDRGFLERIHQVERRLFSYLPNLEVAYYDQDFTYLRNASEGAHSKLILNEQHRARAVAQITDWNPLKKGKNLDLDQIYAQSQTFAQTNYVKAAESAHDPAQAYKAMAQKSLPLSVAQIKDDPHLLDELLMLGMIKNLQALLLYLCDAQHVTKTCEVLAQTKNTTPMPSLFLYQATDYPLLLDIAQLHESFKQGAKTRTIQPNKNEQTAQLQFSLGGLWDDAKSVASKGWDEVKSTASDVADMAKNAGKAVADEAESLGFGTAAMFVATYDPKKAGELLNKAKDLQDKVQKEVAAAADDLGKVSNDALKMANDALDVAQSAAKNAAGWVGEKISQGCGVVIQDTEFCNAAGKTFETVVDLGINALAQQARLLVNAGGGVMRLAADAAATIAKISADVVTGHFSDLGADVVGGLRQIAEDAAASVLDTLSFSLQFFMEQLVGSFKLVSYFIAMITRVFIDVVVAVTYAATELAQTLGAPIDASAIANSVNQTLSAHEQTIGTAITTGLLIATIPLTGGASMPIVMMTLAATLGPQLFSIYGSYQEDEMRADQEHDEQQFVQNYQTYVNNNEQIYKQEQADFLAELQAKYSAEVANQERGLGFNQDAMNTNFESVKEQTAILLGNYWSELYGTNKTTQIPIGDVGALYNIKTGVYAFNPSQGFALYSAARNSFSQEIAASPALILQNQEEETTTVATKFWFDQKELFLAPKQFSRAHIRCKSIYLLQEFYVGIYCGASIDMNAVIASKKAPLDPSFGASLVVFHKTKEMNQPQLGYYQSGTSTTELTPLDGPQFQRGDWYHIVVEKDGSQLRYKCWNESTKEPNNWATIALNTSIAWQSVGAVSSGAAIEYQFIEPKVSIDIQRSQTTYCQLPCNESSPSIVPLTTEVERERTARTKYDFLQAPRLSNNPKSVQLHALDSEEILKGNYIYRYTNGTTSQLVTPARFEENYQGTPTSLAKKSLGTMPGSGNQAPNAFVDLISQAVYADDGTFAEFYCTDALKNYLAARPSISTRTEAVLNKARSSYLAASAQKKFGSFTLTSASSADLDKNLFVYKAPLVDTKNKPITDASGVTLNDFFLFAVVDDGTLRTMQGNPGLSYDMLAQQPRANQAIISLVSGNVYGLNAATPISSGYLPSALLKNYTVTYGPLSATITSAITTSQKAYQNRARTGQREVVTSQKSSQQSASGIANDAAQETAKAKDVPPPPKPAPASIDDRTQAASGSDDNFGF